MFLGRSVVDFRFVNIDCMLTAVDLQCERVNAKVKIWLYPCSIRKAKSLISGRQRSMQKIGEC